MGTRRGRPKRVEAYAALLEIHDREDRALRLKVNGVSVRSIAEQTGVSPGQTQKDLKRAIERRGQRTQDEMRAEASEALEQIRRTFLRQAKRGDANSGDVAIKAIATHARINGYEAPKKVDVRGAGALMIQVTQEVAGGIGLSPSAPALPEAPSSVVPPGQTH